MTELSDATVNNKDKLVSDLKVVVSDAEELLRETANVTGEKMGELRGRLRERLINAKHRLAEAEEAAVAKAKAAARATDDYVHDHRGRPWASRPASAWCWAC